MTLRSAYFVNWKSNPTVLLWGDATGMRALRDFLRGEWQGANASTLDGFCMPMDGRKISVRAASDWRDTGMRLTSYGLEWRLRPDLAEDFADMIDVLARPVKGHQYLDAYNNEIAVEVSIGEHPESLHPARA